MSPRNNESRDMTFDAKLLFESNLRMAAKSALYTIGIMRHAGMEWFPVPYSIFFSIV